jgi:ABC-type polysaccharide/polyol phosphate export permease
MSSAHELFSSWEILRNLTLRELRSKYKRSTLGWMWSLLNPISSIVIYGLVFGQLLDIPAPEGNPSGIKNFMLYLTCALLPWNFLSGAISAGTGSLVGNANLLKKVYFPREYLVVSAVLSLAIAFLIELAVLGIVFAFFGQIVVQWIPIVIALVVMQILLGLGFALALSVANVYFRDTQHFIGIGLQIWFYLTPVVYVVDRYIPVRSTVFGVSLPVRRLYELNPMVHVVNGYRNVFYDGRMPGWQSMAYLLMFAVAVFFSGWAVFRRLEGRIVEEL